MPLVAHSGLPTFERLREEGHEILSADRATHQDIRELHIGLLNMMPDAALEATERQFLRLIGACNRIAQFHVHLFSVDGQAREGAAREHVERHYESFAELRAEGLDALVITGANPAHPDLTKEGFWDGLVEVMEWAHDNVASTLCSCLATHAVLKASHGVERIPVVPSKRWGVFSHRVCVPDHPLLANVNTRFDAPHSHVYEVTRVQIESLGMEVLVDSVEAGVHMAVSADGLRYVFFQGHPEYDRVSLLKEYKREVRRFVDRTREDYPPDPEHYFDDAAHAVLRPFRDSVETAVRDGAPAPELPEDVLEPLVDNTWSDTGKALFNNWLGLVYQLTHRERRTPFMDGVDPEDPLGRRVRR